MTKSKKTIHTKTPPPAKPTGVEFYFDKYAAAHQDPTNRSIQIVFIPVLIFGLFTLLWALPFPYIKFLGAYNADFNWSSFLLAFSIYYYLRMSPILAYVMLFMMMLFCYIITLLQQWAITGGPNLLLLGILITLVASVVLLAGYKKEGKKLSFEYRYKNMLIAPLFLLNLLLKRFKIKY